MSFVGFGLVLYAGLFPGCGTSAEERRRASALGAGCTLDSECDPHFCIFERCHQQCDTDFDCPDEQRCVKGSSDVNVCQLPDERDCEEDSDCDGAQGCAEDGQCRDICRDKGDCVSGQLCTKTGVCVSPERDRLDEDGELISGEGGAGGSAGSAGRGGSDGQGGRGGSGANDAGGEAGGGTSSGTGGMDGVGGAAGAGEGGESGTSGRAGSGGSGVGGSLGGMAGSSGAGGSSGMTGTAGMAGSSGAAGSSGMAGSSGAAGAAGGGGSAPVDETEPNDSRDAPGDLPIDRNLHGVIDPPTTDFDYFEFGPPSGAPVHGYFTWTFTDVGPSSPSVYIYSTVDDGLIYGDETRAAGVSLFGFLGAVAGARYQIRIGRWAGGASVPMNYTLRADYHPVSDIYEPNDTILEASDIELASTVNAYAVVGYESSTVSAADFEDWYGFTTDAGQIEVHVSQVPLNVNIYTRVYDPNGAGVGAVVAGADPGASLAPFTRTLTSSGRYYFRVTYTSAQPQSGAFTDTPDEVPNHFTRPYTFTIRRL
jgi:hypothetical protein